MNSPSDRHLMLQVRDGDLGKLGILFERHHGILCNFFVRLTGNRHLSEDLVQDVFFRMLKYRQSFQDGHDFATWMYQIARNVRIDHYKKHRRELIQEAPPKEQVSSDPGPGEEIQRRQEIELLRGALARLPEEKREVLILSRYQNLKYEQIAGILCCDVGTVKVRVYRAIKQLGEIFFQVTGEKAS